MTTNNNIYSMHKQLVVADLWYRSAEFVVSMRPMKYIMQRENNM